MGPGDDRMQTQSREWTVHFCVFSDNPRGGQREMDGNAESTYLWEVRVQVTFSPFPLHIH